MVAMDGFGTENSTTNAPMIMALVVGSLKFIYGPFKSFWNGREMRVWLVCYLVVLDFHDQSTPKAAMIPPLMASAVSLSMYPLDTASPAANVRMWRSRPDAWSLDMGSSFSF